MSTYLDLCKDVRAQAGIGGDGPTDVTGQTGIYAEVVRWVDEAYNQIQTKHENWNFLYTEESFTLQETFDEYDITSLGIRKIAKDSFLIQYQGGDKEILTYIPFTSWRKEPQFRKAKSDKPKFVTQLPTGELRFWPTADDDYTIIFEGFIRPNIMTDSLDVPIFNEQYHELIQAYALMRYGSFYNVKEVYDAASVTAKDILPRMQFSELPKDNLVTPPFVRFA